MNPDDFIYLDSWKKLAGEIGLPYAETEHALELLGKHPVVLSGHSDYTVARQVDRHPNADLFATTFAVDWERAASVRDGYLTVPIGPTCDVGRCDPAHEFSLRTDRFTWQTFAEVPEGTTWYTTNLDADVEGASLLPFGLNSDNDREAGRLIVSLRDVPKSRLFYHNYQPNCLLRLRLRDNYGRQPWVTWREERVPFGTYLAEAARHQFVACPSGCGVDTHRLWEALYLGSVPVLQASFFSRTLERWKLPVMVVDDLCAVREADLLEWAGKGRVMDCRRLSLAWWRRLLEQGR